MYKTILSVLLICIIGYPVSCKGGKINFQNGAPKSKEGETCYTEEGEEGICTQANKCSEIKSLIKSRGGINTKGTSDIVRRRVCGFTLKGSRVCCLPETIPNNPILPTLDECGHASAGRIFRGEFFQHGAHPWLVGIGYMQSRRNSQIRIGCGGTLITKRHVLTAAHCFDRTGEEDIPEFTHVILGEHSLSEDIERETPITLKIVDRRSPGYIVKYRYKDIELLTLERDVEFNNYIRPACLPFKQYENNFDFSKNMTIAGWGRTYFSELRGTDMPKEAVVPLVPLEECKVIYASRINDFQDVHLDETQICLGRNGSDACRGDSGGPVIFHDKLTNSGRYFVIGVTAFGGDCGISEYPGVYTYVPKYMDWILQNL